MDAVVKRFDVIGHNVSSCWYSVLLRRPFSAVVRGQRSCRAAVRCLSLTHADGRNDGSRDDWQGHAPCDGQVPSVTRGLLPLVVGMDLTQRERDSHNGTTEALSDAKFPSQGSSEA